MGITEQKSNYNSQCSLAQNSDVQPFGVSWEELTAKARKLIFQGQAWGGEYHVGSGCGVEKENFLKGLGQSPEREDT